MEEKDATTLGELMLGITEKIEKQARQHAAVETVLVDLTDELRTCVEELRAKVTAGLIELTALQKDPEAAPDAGFRLLGKIEGWYEGSCLIVDLSIRVLGRIHGKVQ